MKNYGSMRLVGKRFARRYYHETACLLIDFRILSELRWCFICPSRYSPIRNRKPVFSHQKQIYLHTHIIHTLFLKPNFFPFPILQTLSVCWSTLPTAQPPPSLSREGWGQVPVWRLCALLRMRGIAVVPVVGLTAVPQVAGRGRLILILIICANWKVM